MSTENQYLEKKKKSLKKVDTLVQSIPWVGEKFCYSDKEGYSGNGSFGCKSGPVWEFSSLAHEMAHAIEIIETKREKHLFHANWGMKIKSGVEIGGRYYEEPNTLQATERECCVVGIQKRIMEMAGDPTAEALTGYMAKVLLDFMPDWIFGGKDKTERLKTRYDLIQKSYDAWSEEKVVEAWNKVHEKLYVVPKAKKKKSLSLS